MSDQNERLRHLIRVLENHPSDSIQMTGWASGELPTATELCNRDAWFRNHDIDDGNPNLDLMNRIDYLLFRRLTWCEHGKDHSLPKRLVIANIERVLNGHACIPYEDSQPERRTG